MYRLILFILIIILSNYKLFAFFDELERGKEYVVRLINGNILSGELIDFDENEAFIKLKTIIGNTKIFRNEIKEIRDIKEINRHSHRIFLQPTALPVSDNHFIGNYELGMVYFGFGISDFLSFTAGQTFIPTLRWEQQASLINAKVTFMNDRIPSIDANLALAGGVNVGFLNHDNRLLHYYFVGSYVGDKSILTASLYYKTGSDDVYTIKLEGEKQELVYPNGTFGIGLGLDTKFSEWTDVHFIGELWNNDVNKPTQTAILLGLRHANTRFAADFGIVFVTEPMVFPFISFTWTPFN